MNFSYIYLLLEIFYSPWGPKGPHVEVLLLLVNEARFRILVLSDLSTIILLSFRDMRLVVVVLVIVRLVNELLEVDLVSEQSANTTKALHELSTFR